MNRLKVLFLLFVFGFPFHSMAQISLQGGANFCWMQNKNLLQNQKVLLAPQFGVSVEFYPFKAFPEISFENGIILNTKGYRIEIDKIYDFKLRYYSLPFLVHYSFKSKFDLIGGFEFNILYSSNVVQATKTYNNFDFDLLAGFETTFKNTSNFYLRFSYGMVPALSYYTFDELGNFISEFNDLKNLVLTIGIKINLNNEKILL